MAVGSTTLYVDGGAGLTSFQVEARNPRVDSSSGELTFEVWSGNRSGPTFILREADYTVSVNGRQAASVPAGSFKASSFKMAKAQTLTVPIDTSKSSVSVSVTISATQEDADASLSFSVDITQPASQEDISVSCTVPSGDVAVGDPLPVAAVVENSAGLPATVKVAFTAGGSTESVELDVPAGGEASGEAVFVFESDGEYEPTVSASVV